MKEYEIGRHNACPGEIQNAYKVLVQKHDQNTSCGSLGIKRKTMSKCTSKKQCEAVNWIQPAQDRDQLKVHMNMIMDLWVQ
jgi:hypothetical protein